MAYHDTGLVSRNFHNAPGLQLLLLLNDLLHVHRPNSSLAIRTPNINSRTTTQQTNHPPRSSTSNTTHTMNPSAFVHSKNSLPQLQDHSSI